MFLAHIGYGDSFKQGLSQDSDLFTSGVTATGYMANGSFHDELLSVHKTQMVSLTHQRDRVREMLRLSRGGKSKAFSQMEGGRVAPAIWWLMAAELPVFL